MVSELRPLDNPVKNTLISSLVLLDKHLPDARLEPTSKTNKGSAGYHLQSKQDSVTVTAAQLSAELQLGEVIRETKQGRKNIIDDIGGKRLLTGKKVTYQGRAVYLVTIDLDGPNAQKELDSLMGDRQLPATVALTSGKPGRSTLLFLIPEGKHLGLKGKAKIGSKQDGSEVEFHFTGSGSILPPSAHPETGSYKWLPGCSLDEIAIADLPDCLLEVMRDHQPKANLINSLDDIDLPVDQPIPLLECCTKEVRALIESGVPEGSGHNDQALKVSIELVSVKRYLNFINQPFLDSPETLYQQFIANSGIEYGEKEKGRLKGAYKKQDNGPGCKQDGVNNCIRGWYWREILKPNGAKFNNVTPIAKYQKGNYQEPQKGLNQMLLELMGQGLEGSDLETELIAIADHHKKPLKDVKNLYGIIQREHEQNESRQEVKTEIQSLINAETEKIDLKSVLNSDLATPINNLANDMGLRPECYLTALLCGISSVIHPKTKFLISKRNNWELTPGIYGGMIANSSQKKSPVTKEMITRPLSAIQRQEKAEFEEKIKDYQAQLDRYEELKRDRKGKQDLANEFPDGPPVEPIRTIRYTTDMNGEGLKAQLSKQPNQGIISLSDELVALFKSLNKYRKGSDLEDLLTTYDGTGFSILRKTEQTDVYDVNLAIFGGVQPEIFKTLLGDGRDSNGQWARFIFVHQPTVAATLPDDDEGSFDLGPLMEWLYCQVSKLPAQTYRPAPEAFKVIQAAYKKFELLRKECDGHPMANVWGKSPGRIGKLSIVLHTINSVMAGEIPNEFIPVATVTSAVTLTEFFANQIKSLYQNLLNSDNSLAPQLLKINNLAIGKGSITVRDCKRARLSNNTETIMGWFKELSLMDMGVINTRGKTQVYTPSVTSVTKCHNVVTDAKPSHSKDLELSVTSVTTFSTFSQTTKINDQTSDDDFLNKKSVTVVTDEPQTLTQQGLGCVTDLCQVVTDETVKNSQTLTEQALQSVTDVVTDTSPLVFIPGDRVRHPSYGLGIVNEIDGEWYCLWDTLSGGQMRLITEDFQMMEKIA
jgi:hypothetical protein